LYALKILYLLMMILRVIGHGYFSAEKSRDPASLACARSGFRFSPQAIIWDKKKAPRMRCFLFIP
jgi:hypothetical protein